MKRYKVQITNKALSDLEEIYDYIAEQLQAPEAAMDLYHRISDAIETLDTFPERVKLLEIEELLTLELRQLNVDNFSVFYHVRDERVIVTSILYSSSDLVIRLRDF